MIKLGDIEIKRVSDPYQGIPTLDSLILAFNQFQFPPWLINCLIVCMLNTVSPYSSTGEGMALGEAKTPR